MVLLWIFVVNLVHCYAAVENYPCAFLPNDSMKCLEYWTLKEMKHNCTDVKDDLMFTGLIKKVDKEHLISVRASSDSLVSYSSLRRIICKFIIIYFDNSNYLSIYLFISLFIHLFYNLLRLLPSVNTASKLFSGISFIRNAQSEMFENEGCIRTEEDI